MPIPAFLQLNVINMNDLLRNNMNNNDVRYPLIDIRDHLFHNAFVRVALIYARGFSAKERKFIEFLLLCLAFLSLVLLIYIHMAFVQKPSDCLAHVQDKWPKDGVLRVEILQEKLNGQYSLEKSYLKERKIKELAYEDLASYFFLSSGMYDDSEDYKALMESVDAIEKPNSTDISNDTQSTNDTFAKNVTIEDKTESVSEGKPVLPTLAWSDDEYIMEFSLEYGFLKLKPSVRKQYNITVELVTLDPAKDKCFGGPINNFILYNFLGYDEVLLASLKLLASKEEYKVYVRNVITEVEFMFVNVWMDGKSYIMAGFVMMVFTVSISILLRYSHYQIFVFIVEVLHMLEFHSPLNFPAGPLLTVILALVGMEAIMSEFFNDTAIAFYVILIVWMADQFDTICCESAFTKKHWLRFFYLYHFFFYSYSYRFGHNRFLALLTSWFFTVHSMFYFFHRYELPILIARRQRVTNQNLPDNNGNDPPDPDERINDDALTDESPTNLTPSEADQSVSSNSETVSSNQNSENFPNENNLNQNHNYSAAPQTSELEDSDKTNFCRKHLCELPLKKANSECYELYKNQISSVRNSKSFKTVILSRSLYFNVNIQACLILLLILFLFSRNALILALNTCAKSLCSCLFLPFEFLFRLKYIVF